MKKIFLFVLPILLFCACRGDNQKDVLFEMPYRVDFEIPAGLNTIEDHYFQFKNMTSLLDSLLDFHGYTHDDISVINPKTARLTAQFSGEEYDFVYEFSLYLYSGETNPETHEAFWRTEVPLNTNGILDIPGTLLDATEFFLDPRFNAELRFDTRTITSSFVNTQADFTFVVRGK